MSSGLFPDSAQGGHLGGVGRTGLGAPLVDRHYPGIGEFQTVEEPDDLLSPPHPVGDGAALVVLRERLVLRGSVSTPSCITR
jgi:hypothetical protein